MRGGPCESWNLGSGSGLSRIAESGRDGRSRRPPSPDPFDAAVHAFLSFVSSIPTQANFERPHFDIARSRLNNANDEHAWSRASSSAPAGPSIVGYSTHRCTSRVETPGLGAVAPPDHGHHPGRGFGEKGRGKKRARDRRRSPVLSSSRKAKERDQDEFTRRLLRRSRQLQFG